MAIDPSTDIIVDVINAADPRRAAAAAQRLYAIGNSQTPPDFTAALDAAAPARLRSAAPAADPSGAQSGPGALTRPGYSDAHDPAIDFEAVLLNDFIGEMLPKNNGGFFGAGLAGDMWKSMLADQVSRQIATSGALGIGKRLFATHALEGSHSRARLTSDLAASARARVDLSLPDRSAPEMELLAFRVGS